jgi:asparagine synthase (glutamine-hydrolysing)
MCGIYGITERNPEYINSYIRQCSHRGPDGSSIWYDDDISIGHNLLAITSDPDQGKQPVETRHGVLTYNGEIFNYKELVKETDWQPQTTCDTEYLSYALSTMPHETVNEKIDSMHAYAYYNKARKHLILSRDHAGFHKALCLVLK